MSFRGCEEIDVEVIEVVRICQSDITGSGVAILCIRIVVVNNHGAGITAHTIVANLVANTFCIDRTAQPTAVTAGGVHIARIGKLVETGVDEHIHIVRKIGIRDEYAVVVQFPFQGNLRVGREIAIVRESQPVPVRAHAHGMSSAIGLRCEGDLINP